MPSKKTDKDAEENKNTKSIHKTLTCGVKSPGPKYNLKPLVGYNDHCHSKYRNPAYTIGLSLKSKPECASPGPKYDYKIPGHPGYTFPKYVYHEPKDCSPGPKYSLPPFTSPAYTIVPRPKYKCDPPTSGPYGPPPIPIGPAFTFGGKAKYDKCEYDPAVRNVGPVTLLRTRAPAFSIIPRRPMKDNCISPGPKYFPKLMRKSPEFPLGIKHSECKRIPRTECDELC